MKSITHVGLLLATGHCIYASALLDWKAAVEYHQTALQPSNNDGGFGLNEPFIPTPEHILPEKRPFHIDDKVNYYQRFYNGSQGGKYRRSSCPAINALANRGYINRTGRNVTYAELAHAVRRVWNFGDDNVCFLGLNLSFDMLI